MRTRLRNPRAVLAATLTAFVIMSTLGLTRPAHAGEHAQLAPLGQPDHFGYVVADVDAAQDQLAQATGSSFVTSEQTVEVRQLAGSHRPSQVTLKQAVSARETGPATELVQATPAVGPWSVDSRAHLFLSYTVDETTEYAATLERAGLWLVAESDEFAFWRGAGGVTVRLTEDPPVGGPQTPTAPMDFGAPVAVALFTVNLPVVAEQLTRALGITWREPQEFTMTWQLSDGSVRVVTATSTISQEGDPYISLESPHGFPGEEDCSADYSLPYLVYAVVDVPGADAQMEAAGLRFVARVPTVVAAYRSEGVPVEAASQALLPQ